jgi:SNF2 family DNA or RNA helicase
VRATLVVCPMSLLSQWKTEVATHTGIPSSAVHSYYGSDRSADRIRDAAVVLTTYKSYITAPVTVPYIDPPPPPPRGGGGGGGGGGLFGLVVRCQV